MIRSAKMNAMTPPKLMPPFHSTAASGTLPIEQTKRDDRHDGPDQRSPERGGQRVAGEEERLPERVGHPGGDGAGDQQPDDQVRRIAAHSMTNTWLTEVKPCGGQQPPPERALAPGWTCPSRRGPPSNRRCPGRPAPGRRRGAGRAGTAGTAAPGPRSSSGRRRTRPAVNCQPISSARMMPSSITRLVEAISNAIAAVKLAPLRNSDRAKRHRRVGARRRRRAQPGRDRQGARPVVAQQAHDRRPAHHRLHHGRQGEAQDQRPEDLPGHRAGSGEGLTNRAHHVAHTRYRIPPGGNIVTCGAQQPHSCLLAFALHQRGQQFGCPAANRGRDRRQLQLGQFAPSSSKRSEVRLPC